MDSKGPKVSLVRAVTGTQSALKNLHLASLFLWRSQPLGYRKALTRTLSAGLNPVFFHMCRDNVQTHL